MKTNLKTIAENYTEFHKSITIPFNKTSMTIPPILYYAISTKFADPNEYFKQLSNNVKDEILQKGVSKETLVGKLSTKVQELAWCEIIHGSKREDVDVTDFRNAIVVAYAGTTMTIPYSLYKLIFKKCGEDKKFTMKYIKDRASNIRAKILSESELSKKELKGKVSHKIQENLWLDFIPENTKIKYVDAVAS